MWTVSTGEVFMSSGFFGVAVTHCNIGFRVSLSSPRVRSGTAGSFGQYHSQFWDHHGIGQL